MCELTIVVKMGIRENIRREITRRYKGNASAFAKAAKISSPYLNEILNGKRRFNEDFLKKVATALNMPSYQLLADEPLVPYPQVREEHAACLGSRETTENINFFDDLLSLGPGNEISEVPPSESLPFLKRLLPRG